MVVRVGVPKESAPGERRVAIVPEVVQRLAKGGWEVVVEGGAGRSAGYPDDDYTKAGATIVSDHSAIVGDAQVVLKVQAPTAEEIGAMRAGTVVVALMNATRNLGVVA